MEFVDPYFVMSVINTQIYEELSALLHYQHTYQIYGVSETGYHQKFYFIMTIGNASLVAPVYSSQTQASARKKHNTLIRATILFW